MNWIICTHKLQPSKTSGFTLIELLIVLLIVSIMMTAMAGFFQASASVKHTGGNQTEAQQGVRAVLTMVTQELRQAGACLPQIGEFIALDSNGNQDEITIRIGQTDTETLRCIRAATTAEASSGSTELQVGNGEGLLFDGVELVYITETGATGEIYEVDTASASTVTLVDPLLEDHTEGTGIYALDERIFKLDGSILTLSIDGSEYYPVVAGVEKFDVTYFKEPCDPSGCSSMLPPASNTDWKQVREVLIDTDVKAEDGSATESGDARIKPRNLI